MELLDYLMIVNNISSLRTHKKIYQTELFGHLSVKHATCMASFYLHSLTKGGNPWTRYDSLEMNLS